MSDNLGITRLPQGSTTPEVMINAALSEIDAFLSDSVEVDLSAGNITLTIEALKAGNFVSLNGAAEARTVLLPQTKRTLFVRNNGAAEVSLTRGSTTVAVPAAEARTLRLTGAADGLLNVSGGGGGGGDPGGGGGIEEAPTDGKQYARKNASWAEVVTGGGGGGGDGIMPILPPTNGMFDVTYTDGVSTREETYGANFYSALRTDSGRSSDQSVNFRGMTIPNPTGLWRCDAIIKAPVATRAQNVTFALGIRAADGQSYFFGYNPSSSDYLLTLLRFYNNTYNDARRTYGIRQTDYLMFRIEKTTTNHRFFVSSDFGLTFDLFYEEPQSSFSSSPINAIGLNHNSFDSLPAVPKLNRLICPYFKFEAL